MVSFIIPYCTYSTKNPINLAPWKDTDDEKILLATKAAIENINRTHYFTKEIIVVDNSNTFPDTDLPNVKVVKGWQYLPVKEIKKQKGFEKYDIDNFNTLTMWVSMAYNIGIQHAKYDYLVLQHNDIFYHQSGILQLIEDMKEYDWKYVSADGKKLSISGYLSNKELFDRYIKNFDYQPYDGGYVRTKDIVLADCYFFLTHKSFFDDYFVDWAYGDTNHGATVKCLEEGHAFCHLGPYHDNPSFKEKEDLHPYYLKDDPNPFITHLKGGFSEHKMTEEGKFYSEYMNLFYNAKY